MIDTERVAKLEAQVEGIKDNVAELKNDVKEIHSRITTGNREIMEKIDAMEGRLEVKMNSGAVAAKVQHEEIQKEIENTHRHIQHEVEEIQKHEHELETVFHRDIDETRRYIDSRIDKVVATGSIPSTKQQILKG